MGICVRWDTVSASLMSAPEIQETDECVLVFMFIHAILRKSGPAEEDELNLTLFAHTFTAVL